MKFCATIVALHFLFANGTRSGQIPTPRQAIDQMFKRVAYAIDPSGHMQSNHDGVPGRRLEAFPAVPDTCHDFKANIATSQSAVLADLTDPSKYDRRKRPNTAPVNSGWFANRSVSTDADEVYITLMVDSIVKIDSMKQELTVRCAQHAPPMMFVTRISTEHSCACLCQLVRSQDVA